jgi:hypothetical protein
MIQEMFKNFNITFDLISCATTERFSKHPMKKEMKIPIHNVNMRPKLFFILHNAI